MTSSVSRRRFLQATAAVVGVLHAHQRRRTVDNCACRVEGCFELVEVIRTTGTFQWQGLTVRYGADAARFIAEQMRAAIENDRVAWLAMCQDGAEIAHRTAGDEQGGFLAEDGRGFLLQQIDGRVLVDTVIADFGIGHCLAHCRVRLGVGVAA